MRLAACQHAAGEPTLKIVGVSTGLLPFFNAQDGVGHALLGRRKLSGNNWDLLLGVKDFRNMRGSLIAAK
jgi:hypothetical protein